MYKFIFLTEYDILVVKLTLALPVSFHCQHTDLVRIEEQFSGGRRKACILIVVQHIATHLGPLLATPYVVEACLVPALAEVAEVASVPPVNFIQGSRSSGTAGLNLPKAHILFDFLMASLEVRFFFSICIIDFSTSSNFSPLTFSQTKMSAFSISTPWAQTWE